MASHLQTPPKQPSVEEGTSQEILASEDKEQHPADLKVPYSAPRKRRSANAPNEQSLPQKHTIQTGMDFGDNGALIEPGGDEGQIKLPDIGVQVAQLKLDREERAKSKGYVEKEISRLCMSCRGRIPWYGKCKTCVQTVCCRWLEMIEPDEPNGEPVNEYLSLLDALWDQHQDRLTKEEEKWKKF